MEVFKYGPHKGETYHKVRTLHPDFFFSLIQKPVTEVLHELDFIQYCMSYLTKDEDEDKSEMKPITAMFDGCSKGNPGISGAGAHINITETEEEIWNETKYVGDCVSNNVAEYHGILLILHEIEKKGYTHVTIKGDSKLVIEQIQKKVNTRSPSIKPLNKEACEIVDRLRDKGVTIVFQHVLRKFNKRADELANDALKKASS